MPTLCEGVIREKVARYDAKLRRQSGNRFRYTWEMTIDGREVVACHIDMAAAKEYVARLPDCRILLPWSRMNDGERIRAKLAREQLEVRLNVKHVRDGVVLGSLKVVA